jgi:hypothetical protein
VGIPLAVFTFLAFKWGGTNLVLCIRILQGKLPFPPRSSQPFVYIGVVFYLLVIAIGSGSTYFLLALETIQPTVILDDGIKVGAQPLWFREKFIPWHSVSRVTCNIPPRGGPVRIVDLYSSDSEVQLGNAGANLEQVIEVVLAKAPSGTVEPCKEGALDHSWSY